MNLTVAVLMHQPEIREVVRTSVVLGHHMVHVDFLTIIESLVAVGTETVLSPGELPRAASHDLGSVPPLAPVVLKGRIIGGIGGGDESMADDFGPGEFPEGPMPLLIREDPAVLSTADPAPILLSSPPAGRFVRSSVPPCCLGLTWGCGPLPHCREPDGRPDSARVAAGRVAPIGQA